jgi:TatD DNase family protein
LSAIVEIADGPEEWPKAQALAEKYPGKMWWAAGLHPYYADQSSPEVWTRLKKLAAHPQFVAVGEIGLDYAKCPIPPEKQREAFRLGIETALAVDKPLIIHCRDAYPDLMPILRELFGSKKNSRSPGVVHCFSGNPEQAAELVQLGFYLGIDGPVTYPNSNSLRLAIKDVPVERLVLETDSPYLPPQTHRGQRNEPAHLPLIGSHLAHLKSLPETTLADRLTGNSFALFRLKNPA